VAKENNEFSYERTLKHRADDTFLNFQHYLLITSKQITKFLFNTSVTPHQVILFSLLIGVLSSFLIINDNKIIVIVGAVFLFYKNVLDKVDGSLARSKNMVSRRGRFYDSISDFIVSFSLFTAIGFKLNQNYDSLLVWVICFSAFITSMLQCSFFVYYEVAFIKQTGKNTVNRLLESVTDEDLQKEDKLTIMLQRIFQFIYGWQDYLMYLIDKSSLSVVEKKITSLYKSKIENHKSEITIVWYRDKFFLSLSSLLGIGTHMVLIALFAVIGRFEYYLILNLILWNLLLISAVPYHYFHTLSILKPGKN
jgi:phosphatidylglycerophosphate synthase